MHNRYAIQEEIIHILDGFAHTSTVRVLAAIINVVTEIAEPPVRRYGVRLIWIGGSIVGYIE